MRISESFGRQNRRGKGRAVSFFVFVIIIILALAIWIDSAIRPIVESIVAYQAQVLAAQIVNEALITQMEEKDVNYDGLVKITRGEDGGVVSVEADIVQINRLKTYMSNAVLANLEKNRNKEILVPAGTLVGNHFTSGRGPNVTIKAIPTGYVQSEIYNQFSAAGINQTLHQIMLNINIQMLAVLPGYTVKTETTTSFCIAETIIVGKIPQGYAVIDSGAATFLPVKE